jgi:parallel beta-helix repeat protein
MRKLLPLVLGLALLAPASASAETPPCGSVITRDVTFDRDLICFSDGLTIGADGVTVDLDRHFISLTFGTDISSSGFDHVKVLNGGLLTQGVAVDMSRGHHNLVRNVTGFGDVAGVRFSGGSRNRVVDSSLDCRQICFTGAYVLEHERYDAILRNGPLQGGIALNSTRRSRLTGNRVAFGRGPGIELDASSRRNRVEDNDVLGDELSQGVTVAGNRNRLLRNELSGGGVFLVTGARNRLVGNRVSGSQADGIEVTGRGNRLRGNVAVDNALLGINALFGTIDLGRNRASGNGDPRECVGVICSP